MMLLELTAEEAATAIIVGLVHAGRLPPSARRSVRIEWLGAEQLTVIVRSDGPPLPPNVVPIRGRR